ncbi:polyprenyl synthetase family protein [Streptococcus zalophi]|uniref:Polyprenyl synthetase family protein n=1 Tax=Streptococcus zalophi TaxID=640031 RepID=A0A934P8U5_9STRE|nr:polyprenyl synthetase family protein [Streptococcus zalophi]MBJ8349088.1 polyprenyl synthetase family protein [Streptococcus zalophi]MCR8967761.1 polyprenyl synthetase family protein [Streptococcus zalophi]
MIHTLWENYPEINKALEEVKEIMLTNISVIHPEVKQKITDYINASGKYVRAGLLVMLAKATDGEIKTGKLYLAASVEILHLATLIHDDVIDQAGTRRGIETLHQSFSNKIAIYAGDYLLSYSSKLALKGFEDILKGSKDLHYSKNNYRIIERVLSGELSQLMNSFNEDISAKAYLKQIRGKTAFLFGMATKMGVITAHRSAKELNLAFNVGQSIGMAFQLTDDLIDFKKPQVSSGKPQLQDVQNGIYTYPLIIAKSENKLIQPFLSKKKRENWSQKDLIYLQNLIKTTSGFLATEQLINRYIAKSFKQLKLFLSEEKMVDIVSLIEKLFQTSL